MTPHVMCRSCQFVFPSDAKLDEEVTCPECGHSAEPAGVMRPTGFPSLETFRRNWQKAHGGTAEYENGEG